MILLLIIINAAIVAYIISGGLATHEGIRELLSKLYVWKVGLKWYLVALILYPLILVLSLIYGVLSNGSSLNTVISQISWDAFYGVILSYGYIGLIRGPLREEVG